MFNVVSFLFGVLTTLFGCWALYKVFSDAFIDAVGEYYVSQCSTNVDFEKIYDDVDNIIDKVYDSAYSKGKNDAFLRIMARVDGFEYDSVKATLSTIKHKSEILEKLSLRDRIEVFVK